MSSERRRFFRIDDRLGIALQSLSEAEVEAFKQGESLPVDAYSLLSSYDVRIEQQLTQLNNKEPLVAELLDNLNKKLNCIVSQLEMESRIVQRIAHKVQEVNISACGLAFFHDTPLAVDTLVSLDLLLKPTNVHVVCLGRVVGCDAVEGEDTFYLRIDFEDLTLADQETLIQHIVRRQGAMLRDNRLQTSD